MSQERRVTLVEYSRSNQQWQRSHYSEGKSSGMASVEDLKVVSIMKGCCMKSCWNESKTPSGPFFPHFPHSSPSVSPVYRQKSVGNCYYFPLFYPYNVFILCFIFPSSLLWLKCPVSSQPTRLCKPLTDTTDEIQSSYSNLKYYHQVTKQSLHHLIYLFPLFF